MVEVRNQYDNLFLGSAWERTAETLRVSVLFSFPIQFGEAEPRGRPFPGRAWERVNNE